MVSAGFPRRLRLRRRVDFLRVQKRGVKHHTRHFLVFVAPSGQIRAVSPRPHVDDGSVSLPATRLGVTVTRKVGKAVDRNRIKRLVREAFRRERPRFHNGVDMVWVAKRDAIKVTYQGVVAQMRTLADRLGPRAMPGRRPEVQ